MISNIFLVLTAYYLIKPVREGWLAISDIQGFTKLEVKAYSAFAQSLVLIAILPGYAWLAAVLPRRRLILTVGSAFGFLLVVFWSAQPGMPLAAIPFVAVVFYLFVGIFSVTLVAQFWAFTSDMYGPERGKRLFPLIAVGAAGGAVFGSWLGENLMRSSSIEAFDLIIIALAPLIAALALATWSDKRGTYGDPSAWTTDRWEEPAAPTNQGAMNLIISNKYLLATAMMILTFSWVVASGDNILFGIVQETIQEDLTAQSLDPAAYSSALKEATTAFYSNLYFWVNLSALILQSFFVSRILRFGGMPMLLLTTPFVSLIAYATMAFTPILGLIKVMKIAENSSNYSVHNTARHMLWLPTTKEMLYQAKPTIDTLFVRLGDGLAALTIMIGTRVVKLDYLDFIGINLALIIIWIGLSIYLQREHRRWSKASHETSPLPIPK
jgi:AAA family ATP:ADP antiporter